MGQYLLDLETTGLDFIKDKIITIQFREIDNEGNPISELFILKEWESSEEEIVKRFHKIFNVSDKWRFIPITYGNFDLIFLYNKFKQYNLEISKTYDEFIYSKPYINLRGIGIFIKKIKFKDSGLDDITEKKRSGDIIPIWYHSKEYDKILLYIIDEMESFIKFVQKCIKVLSTQEWKEKK